MVVVWLGAAIGILIALPGPLFEERWRGCCRGSGLRLALPIHPIVYEQAEYSTLIVMEGYGPRGLITSDGQRRTTSANGDGPFRFAFQPRTQYVGYPLWAVHIDHRRYIATPELCTPPHFLQPLSPLRHAMCERFLADRAERAGYGDAAARIRSSWPLVRINWRGVGIDAILAGVTFLGIASLMRTPKAICRMYRHARTRLLITNRLRRNLCPTCRYDLRGLPGQVCPECGAGFVLNEPRP